eukprot:TRINITY_DN7070_c0_g2_i1.p2 TRINITY_DN7070_c0_g2~~TRINITY_DN7070_c0_g2_i1.p2  ORF type:complete len:116 (-),score=22.18 TRINITY_DN7070_c0_g2_i1:5-352(-)
MNHHHLALLLQVLSECLDKCDDQLGSALRSYQQQRAPDAKAITRIMVLGYPWQYKQAPLREKLAFVNMAFRAVLSKKFPKYFDPQVRCCARGNKRWHCIETTAYAACCCSPCTLR